MSEQTVVSLDFKGQQFYTHTSWLSQKQHNSRNNIPKKTKSFAIFITVATFGAFALSYKGAAYVRSLPGSYATIVGSYLTFLVLIKFQEQDDFRSVILRNDCGTTPLWLKEKNVVNLREKDQKVFMSLRQGQKIDTNEVKKYSPDSVLLGSEPNNILEKIV